MAVASSYGLRRCQTSEPRTKPSVAAQESQVPSLTDGRRAKDPSRKMGERVWGFGLGGSIFAGWTGCT